MLKKVSCLINILLFSRTGTLLLPSSMSCFMMYKYEIVHIICHPLLCGEKKQKNCQHKRKRWRLTCTYKISGEHHMFYNYRAKLIHIIIRLERCSTSSSPAIIRITTGILCCSQIKAFDHVVMYTKKTRHQV